MTEVVRTPTVTMNRDVMTVTWAGLDADDSGQAVDMQDFTDVTVQVLGTFNGGTMTLYGSNDPRVVTDRNAGTLFGSKTAEWVGVTDPQANAIAKAAAAIESVLESPAYMCPVVTGGGGSTALTVIAKCVRKRI